MTVGTIHPKNSLFLRTHVGEAKGEKITYQLSQNVNGSPMIQSGKTRQFFSLNWLDIITLAIRAGIDK